MPQIISLRELNNPSKISKMSHESDAPIFVTKNGVSDMVIMSSESYDRLAVGSRAQYNFQPEQPVYLAEPSSLAE